MIKLRERHSCKYIFRLTLAIFIVSLGFQLFISNKYAVKGMEMLKLKNRKDVLASEILNMQLEASSISSLMYVEEKAKELGFVELEGEINLIDTPHVAARY